MKFKKRSIIRLGISYSEFHARCITRENLTNIFLSHFVRTWWCNLIESSVWSQCKKVPSDFIIQNLILWKFLTFLQTTHNVLVMCWRLRKKCFIVTLSKYGDLFGWFNLVNPDWRVEELEKDLTFKSSNWRWILKNPSWWSVFS